MVECFDCGKKISWKDAKRSGKDVKSWGKEIGYTDQLQSDMGDKDMICIPCVSKLNVRHALRVCNYMGATMQPKEFENWAKEWPDVIKEQEKLLTIQQNKKNTQQTKSIKQRSDETVDNSTNESDTTVSTSNITHNIQNTLNVTSADQLRTLTSSRHNEFKDQWDKNGIVQYKNDRIAILKRVVGQQVQFIVAYDQVTAEGYRLMTIDEGMTASGSGFSGGASAYFYFQKMDYVR
jgi:hypothetical protein